ncbi:hypothetical protein [Velocimicrobium porci]|uniref:Uncharacterized protein n=1 Tax=Velocimicrobium porci TaxID=2606634 RepID=A0A6L5XZA4_9FIRM|nr:hypothetical protein [Velocimicrobium porci]MSS64044.1 hypothetical protein [Velocimicrobium porci]
MIKCETGEWGYIKKKKWKQLLLTLLMAFIGIGIFLTGYYFKGKSNQSIFTVLAVLMVLPGAKFFVSFVVLAPYHTPKREQYDELIKILRENGKLFSDMVITSSEKVMNLDFILVSNGQVLGVVGREKQDLAYIQSYLTKGVRNWSSNEIVKIYSSYDELVKAVKKISEKEVNLQEEEKVIAYLTSLIV